MEENLREDLKGIYHLFLASSIHDRIYTEKTRISRLDSNSVIACLEDKILVKKAKNMFRISLPSGNLLIIVSPDLPHYSHG